jgi:hypothetical protein
MCPASAVNCGSSGAEPIAAATTGQPAWKSLSVSRRSQYPTKPRNKTFAPRSVASSIAAVMAPPA